MFQHCLLSTEVNHLPHFISELFPGKGTLGLSDPRSHSALLLSDLGCPDNIGNMKGDHLPHTKTFYYEKQFQQGALLT